MSAPPTRAGTRLIRHIVADEAMEEGGDVVAETSNGKRSEGDSDEDGGDAEDVDFDMDAPGRRHSVPVSQ